MYIAIPITPDIKNLDALEAARQAEDAQIEAVVLRRGTFPRGGLPG
jgi:hypothetical protein